MLEPTRLSEIVELILGVYLLRFGLIAIGIAALVGIVALILRARRRRGRDLPVVVPAATWIARHGLGERGGRVVRALLSERGERPERDPR